MESANETIEEWRLRLVRHNEPGRVCTRCYSTLFLTPNPAHPELKQKFIEERAARIREKEQVLQRSMNTLTADTARYKAEVAFYECAAALSELLERNISVGQTKALHDLKKAAEELERLGITQIKVDGRVLRPTDYVKERKARIPFWRL
jgi:hypothetical protein